jgi:hypothetical protein
VGDAATERRRPRIFLVHMHGVEVGGHAGEEDDVRIGDGLGGFGAHADLHVFDVITVARVHCRPFRGLDVPAGFRLDRRLSVGP